MFDCKSGDENPVWGPQTCRPIRVTSWGQDGANASDELIQQVRLQTARLA
jgi:hypothetical protein